MKVTFTQFSLSREKIIDNRDIGEIFFSRVAKGRDFFLDHPNHEHITLIEFDKKDHDDFPELGTTTHAGFVETINGLDIFDLLDQDQAVEWSSTWRISN